jgi:hypothetical protein
MKVKYYGTWDAKGKLQAAAFVSALNGFRSRRVPVVFTVEEDKGKRSTQANKYYWGVVVELIHMGMKDAGHEVTREATHELLKYRFLREDVPLGNDGEFVTTIKSTCELNREEFAQYIEHCQRFAAEYLNVTIPNAGEQMEIAA